MRDKIFWPFGSILFFKQIAAQSGWKHHLLIIFCVQASRVSSDQVRAVSVVVRSVAGQHDALCSTCTDGCCFSWCACELLEPIRPTMLFLTFLARVQAKDGSSSFEEALVAAIGAGTRRQFRKDFTPSSPFAVERGFHIYQVMFRKRTNGSVEPCTSFGGL